MKTILIAVLTLLLVCDQGFARVRRQAEARSEEDDNTLSDQGNVENVTIVTKSEIIRAPVGGLASLPCTVNVAVTQDSDFALVWLKNDVTISVDGTVFEFDDPTDLKKRLSFGADGPVTIENLRLEDSGNYTCRVSETSFVSHILDVQVKPSNVSIAPSGSHLIAKKGEHVRVSCSASGNPAPEIKWYDKTDALVKDGPVLEIHSVEHKTAGRYACHAINSLGKEVRHVTITLKHKPDVKARKEYVSAALGGGADLVCDIHHSRGESPRVEWLKNDAAMSDAAGMQSLHEEKEHNAKATLRLAQIRPEDLAKYTCRAENDIGSSEASITVTDTPAPARLVNPPSVNKNNVTLTWSVESSSPLEDIELRYKKDQAKEWENVKLSVSSAVGQDMWFIKHTLSGLEGKHHAVLLTKNSRGWSPASTNIVFNSNNPSETETAENAIEATGGSATNELCTMLSTCALILLWRLRG